MELLADERSETACTFLSNTVSCFTSQNVRVERVMTDNGSAFVSKPFRERCGDLGLRHKLTRLYTPRTKRCSANGCRFAYQSSAERKRWLIPTFTSSTAEPAPPATTVRPLVARIGTTS